MVKACLNGARAATEHPSLPLSPDQLAAEATAAVAAGAGAVHIHPRDGEGGESLAGEHVGPAVQAIRAACPGIPVGVTTGAWIEPDAERRVALIAGWAEEPPDFASVNFDEDGATDVAATLRRAGIGVEAGLQDPETVALLDGGPLVRALIEPEDEDGEAAWAAATQIASRLAADAVEVPLLAHGFGHATWTVVREAQRIGLDVRVGLEDTFTLPDGKRADGNAALVAAAIGLG